MISGMRTRSEMEAFIARGFGVMLPGGGVATRVEELPSEAALARMSGDPARESAARDAIRSQIDALKAQLADPAAVVI